MPDGTIPAGSRGIDIHAHVVPENFPPYLGSSMGGSAPASWPSMIAAGCGADGLCHRHVVIAGRNYRTVSERCWSTPHRLADLPAMGLGLQVLSPMPELLSYWFAPEAARQLLRFLNEQIASMVAESDGALLGFCAVPLQDVDLAIAELRHGIETLGLCGVEIGSNVDGVPIGDPRFVPFFEACEALDAAVFVHAVRPAGTERLVGPPPLQQVLAYPTDVGLAAASVITTNLMLRCPRLRIAFSHGGGTLASLLPRLQQGWSVFPALREQITTSPGAQARQLYYDSLVFDGATLRHLVDTFGATQLMLGTDYPFNFQDREPVARLRASGLDDDTVDRLCHRNAEVFLASRARVPHERLQA